MRVRITNTPDVPPRSQILRMFLIGAVKGLGLQILRMMYHLGAVKG